MTTDQIELSCGTRRARFRRDAAGWRPVGFFLGDELRLRFKDDAFLSLNTLRPVAQTLERVGTGVRFGARTDYFGLPVDWSVTVTPEPAFNGFTIETAVTPTATLEVMEGLSFFETPAAYDDTEEALHVIGMNPVMKWRGTECVTPALPWNPIKAWSHKRAHRNLIATQTPLLATRLSQGGAIRGYAFLGHWDVCAARGLAVTPVQGAEPHGYLFDIGAMTWRTSSLKDPNYIFEAGQTQRQKVSLTYDDAPGGTIDEWLFAPFEFALRHYLPADGRRAPARVTLAEANRWWRNTRRKR